MKTLLDQSLFVLAAFLWLTGCQVQSTQGEPSFDSYYTAPSYNGGTNTGSPTTPKTPVGGIVEDEPTPPTGTPVGPGSGGSSNDDPPASSDDDDDREDEPSDEEDEPEEMPSDPPDEEEEIPADELLRWTDFESQVFELINQRRAENGVAPLEKDNHLREAAYLHSKDMADNNFMSHTGSDGSSFSTRIRRTAFAGSPGGENVASGQRTPEQVMEAWMNSSGHRRNILNAQFRYVGVGVHEGGRYGSYSWTQVFGQ